MIKLELPFSMGTETIDPLTLVAAHDHPILEIGSSYSTLRIDVYDWLVEQHGQRAEGGWDFKFDGGNYCLWFKTEADRDWFILRWA